MTVVNKNTISNLAENSPVDAWVLIQVSRVQTAANKKQYLSWEGMDAAGRTVKGTLFEDKCKEGLPSMLPGEVWSIGGAIGSGRMGLMVFANVMVRVLEPSLIDQFMDLCVPTLPADQLATCISTIEFHARSIKDDGLRQLAGCLWSYMLPFMGKIPAAKGIHEPYRGGLARHTTEVLTVALGMSEFFGLNKDVIVFSAIFHDMGKIQTYTDLMTMTHEGKMMPHSFLAIKTIAQALVSENIVVDSKLLTHVEQCIMSHSGEHAEQVPCTREAIVLHHADMVCSKLGHITEIIKGGSVANDGWSSFDRIIDSTVYIPEMDNLQ